MFNALSAVKLVVSGIVGVGTGKIVSGIVKDHVNPETLIDKVAIVAATWTLSGVVTNQTKKYTNDMIDEVYTNVSDAVASVRESAKLNRINRGESTFMEEGLDINDYIQNPDKKWTKKTVVDETTSV